MGDSPKIPDANQAAIAGVKADVSNFPQEYIVNAAAQQGGKVTIGGKTYDFTGLGNADQSAAATRAMDQAQLEIQQKYGPGYIAQSLADLQQSNPTGVAARNQLSDSIISDSKNPIVSPLAQQTQDQVSSMLDSAGNLDPQALEQIQQGVRGQQVQNGITLGNAPANQEADAVVAAGDTLRAQQQGAAENYLASGVSPEDVQYRQIQQSLSNLGAFVNGQTPEAQFGQLSGASSGAAPVATPNYTTPATLNQNAGQYGINFANQSYNTSQENSNPWLAGLSTLTTGANALANTGVFNSAAQPANINYVGSTFGTTNGSDIGGSAEGTLIGG